MLRKRISLFQSSLGANASGQGANMAVEASATGILDSSDAALFDRVASLPRWFTSAALQPVKEINLQMLTLMRRQPPLLPVADSIALQLGALPEEALDRIARSPCLLVEAGFHDDRRWSLAKQTAAHSRVTDSVGTGAAPAVIAWARATLFVSWHFARIYPEAVDMAIGTSAVSAQALRELTLDDLEQLACAHTEWFQPRWVGNPVYWQQLIGASQLDSAPFTAELKGLQLVLGQRWRETAMGSVQRR